MNQISAYAQFHSNKNMIKNQFEELYKTFYDTHKKEQFSEERRNKASHILQCNTNKALQNNREIRYENREEQKKKHQKK